MEKTTPNEAEKINEEKPPTTTDITTVSSNPILDGNVHGDSNDVTNNDNSNIDLPNTNRIVKKAKKNITKKQIPVLKPKNNFSMTGNFNPNEYSIIKAVMDSRIKEGLTNDVNHFVRQCVDFALCHHIHSSQYLKNIPSDNNGLFGYDVSIEVKPLNKKGFYNK